jgi:outer membrane protein, multidrug efflux system
MTIMMSMSVKKSFLRWMGPATFSLAVVGCSSLQPSVDPKSQILQTSPAQWDGVTPAHGQSTDLRHWWARFDDALLSELIQRAQDVSPTLASARSRIEQARATGVASGARLLPDVQVQGGISRGRQEFSAPLATTASGQLQVAWELDVWGGNLAGRSAARSRLDAAQAGWHDARILVAAEVARTYLEFRGCERQLALAKQEAQSRGETARLSDLSAQAGFLSPATAAVTRASAAQGLNALSQAQTQCVLLVKALKALTSLEETELNQRLVERSGQWPAPATFAVQELPAQVLLQRPDLWAAAFEVGASQADIGQSQGALYPRVVLNGSLGRIRVESSTLTQNGTLWSLGPVSVVWPIFDGGLARANVAVAKVRYQESQTVFGAKLRTAVREVESAWVSLQSLTERLEQVRIAAEGFQTSLRATEARFKEGLDSALVLEEARRQHLLAQTALIDLQREQIVTWISLYRAMGGGWTIASDASNPVATPPAASASMPVFE